MTNTYNSPGDGDVWFSVTKTWDDTGYESSRPAQVSADIYRDGEVYDKVELSEDNSWAYDWIDEKGHEWTVTETTTGTTYTATVSSEGSATTGAAFTVKNTYTPPENPPDNPPENPPDNPENPPSNPPDNPPTTTPPTSNPPKSSTPSVLPKTGDLWWPVAPLACAGILCFIAALWLNRRRRDS